MNFEEFENKINQMFNDRLKEQLNIQLLENSIEMTYQDNTYSFTKDDYDEINKYGEKYIYSNGSIWNPKEYQILVKEFNNHMLDRFSEIGDIQDNQLNIKYTICKPSIELLLSFIANNDFTDYWVRMPMYVIDRHINDASDELSPIKLIDIAFKNCVSIKIDASCDYDISDFKDFSDAFIFQMAYNTNRVFKKILSVDDIFYKKTGFSHRAYRPSNYDFMPPRLAYKDDLTEQYYTAITSDDVYVQFLCYYHIFEHFFEEVFQEDLFNSIKQIIVHPSFSLKKNTSIAEIVKVVNQKNKQNKQGFQGSELEALELTIKKYISIDELINELDNIFIDYYKQNKVPFSDGDAIDLMDRGNSKLEVKLAARIYKTRNALVHSKSNEFKLQGKEKGIYRPFSDKKDLAKEIPLMKIIAEMLIINTAKEL